MALSHYSNDAKLRYLPLHRLTMPDPKTMDNSLTNIMTLNKHNQTKELPRISPNILLVNVTTRIHSNATSSNGENRFPTTKSGHSYPKYLIIGVSVASVLVLAILIIILVLCILKKKGSDTSLSVLPVTYGRRRNNRYRSDRAHLTSECSSHLDENTSHLRQPLQLDKNIANHSPEQVSSIKNLHQIYRTHDGDEDVEDMLKDKRSSSVVLDEFFSDEVYKQTDFSDAMTQKANTELSPNRKTPPNKTRSGLDIEGLEELLLECERDSDWLINKPSSNNFGDTYQGVVK